VIRGRRRRLKLAGKDLASNKTFFKQWMRVKKRGKEVFEKAKNRPTL